jgi:hypothetical protein
MPQEPLSDSERPRWRDRALSYGEGAEALSGGRNLLSRGYRVAAWIFLALAVLLWLPFATVAPVFYLSAFLLRREGL